MHSDKRSPKEFDTFVKKANEIHNNKYDYSTALYSNSYTHIPILCHKHGIFNQRPDSHLRGYGCSACNRIELIDGTTWDSKIEAWYYLTVIKRYGLKFVYNGMYGLGKRRYDFYFPLDNKYVEITSYNNRSKIWDQYIININEKKSYTEKILLAKFEFIQKILGTSEVKLVHSKTII